MFLAKKHRFKYALNGMKRVTEDLRRRQIKKKH